MQAYAQGDIETTSHSTREAGSPAAPPDALTELPSREPGSFYSITYRFVEEQKNLSGGALELYHTLASITDSRVGSTTMWRVQGVSAIGLHRNTISAKKRELLEHEVIWQIGRPHRRYRERSVLDRVVLYHGKGVRPCAAAGNGRPIPALEEGLYFSMPNVFVGRFLPWIKPRENRVYVALQPKCRHDTGIAEASWEHLLQYTNHRYVLIRQALTWLGMLGLIKLLSVDDERIVAAMWQPTSKFPVDNLSIPATARPQLEIAKILDARLSTSKRDTLRAQRRLEARANTTPSKGSKETMNVARTGTCAPATPSASVDHDKPSEEPGLFGCELPTDRSRRRRRKDNTSSTQSEVIDRDAAERDYLTQLARDAKERLNRPAKCGGVV